MPPLLSRLRDPLLERDYARLCSRTTTFRNRALFAGVVGVMLLLTLLGQRRETALDKVGWTLHLVFTWGAAFLVSLQALSESASAVPTERATGTLTVLLTVPLSHRRLAAGFLLSRYALSLTSFLALVPLEGIALLLGGVSGADLLAALAAIATAALFGAAVGLLAGSGASGHRQAIGRATFLSLFLTVLLPLLFLLAAWLASIDRDRPDEFSRALLKASGAVFLAGPLSPLYHLSGRGIPLPALAAAPGIVHGLPATVALLLAVVAVLATGRGLTLEDERAAAGAGGGLVGLLRRRKGGASPAPAVAGETAPPFAAGVWKRPLWWRETRPPRHRWARWGLALLPFGYAWLVLWLMLDRRTREALASPEGFGMYDFLLGLPWWAMALAVLTAGGTYLAEERERSSLDLLRAAPLTPADYAVARPLGILWKGRYFLATSLLLCACASLSGLVVPLAPAFSILGFLLLVPFLAMLSLRVGMGAHSIRHAARRMGLLAGTLLLGWPIGLGLLQLIARNLLPRSLHDKVFYLFALDPVVAMVGPLVLFFSRLSGGAWDEASRFGLGATAAAAACTGLAVLRWRRLPRDLDRAMHGGEE